MNTPPLPVDGSSQSGAVEAPAQTSGLAIAALVLGFFGFLVLPAIGGIVCGVLALSAIQKSKGRIQGNGLAISGIVLSGVMLAMVPILAIFAGLLLPALSSAKSKAQIIQSVNHMKQLGLGARIWAVDHDENFPPAARWCDDLTPMVGNSVTFTRPADTSGARCGYGYNVSVAGKKSDAVDPSTVLFFELETGGWNVSGGPELLRRPKTRGDVLVIGFADGSVQQVRPEQIGTLRWDAGGKNP